MKKSSPSLLGEDLDYPRQLCAGLPGMASVTVEAGRAAGGDPAEVWNAMVRAAIGQEDTV